MICIGGLDTARDYSFRDDSYKGRVAPVSRMFASGDQFPDPRKHDHRSSSRRPAGLYGPQGATSEPYSVGLLVDVVA